MATANAFGTLPDLGANPPIYTIPRTKTGKITSVYPICQSPSPQVLSLIVLILSCSIIDLLVQLFWKQNRYLNNNSRYNVKSTDSHSRGGSADQSTPAREVQEQSATSSSTTSFHAQKRKSENKMLVSLSTATFAAAKTNHSILGPQHPQGQLKSRRHLQ